jgi:hypothetical protein
LLAPAKKGREEAERRWKWVRTKVKEASPQLLATHEWCRGGEDAGDGDPKCKRSEFGDEDSE